MVRWYNTEGATIRTTDPKRWEHVRQIDVFGFSRGSAEAREFANQLKKRGIPVQREVIDNRGRSKLVNTGEHFNNVDIRFLGLFDTVATGLHGFELSVDSKFVRNTRQAAAADEFRRAFPLTSLRSSQDADLPHNEQEYFFHGAHSDIGGGTAPGEQGKTNALARVTLNYMHDEAVNKDVQFNPIVGDDSAQPDLHQLTLEEQRRLLIHDSRRYLQTGIVDFLIQRHSRTIHYGDDSKQTLSREELDKLVKDSERSRARTIKESSDGLILEPMESSDE